MNGVMLLDNDGPTVDVVYLDPAIKGTEVTRLLDAARREGSHVALRTGGRDKTFRITRTVAETVGYLTPPATTGIGVVEVVEPPRTGPGASKVAWREYLQAMGVEVPELGATRDQLIAAWDATHTAP